MNAGKRTYDLRSELEREHSKQNTVRIARRIGSDETLFSLLMTLVLSGDRMVSQRASWVMSDCIENTPSLALPWIDKMIRRSQEKDIHNAVQRNILRSLQFVVIPKRLRGIAVNVCAENLQSVHTAVAAKVFSMSVLTNIAQVEPDLRREVVFLVEPLTLHASAGVRSRSKKALKLLTI